MEITKLSTKGRLILPKTRRDAHGWTGGTELVVEETLGGVTLLEDPPADGECDR
jgi:AbrB family looped-hinge helix DNA binding protein